MKKRATNEFPLRRSGYPIEDEVEAIAGSLAGDSGALLDQHTKKQLPARLMHTVYALRMAADSDLLQDTERRKR
ncbi:MAG: hypothetical protein KDD10_09410 [Phaeodactylibacter sp.]|nr:hypothetical protein [Phaeodactylibacter sp.]MCO6493610.1 hypothetical protein [Phaeodactylibacter sp.]